MKWEGQETELYRWFVLFMFECPHTTAVELLWIENLKKNSYPTHGFYAILLES